MVVGTDDPTNRAAKHRRESLKQAADHVCEIAYEILDEIICPIVGMKGVWADIFQAEPSLYVSDKKKIAVEQRKKIITKVAKKYGADEYALAQAWRQPLALFALVAMSHSGYIRSSGKGKDRKLTAKDAWEHLAGMDKKLAKAMARRRS